MQTLDELQEYLDSFLPTAMVSYAFTREARDVTVVGRAIASLLPPDTALFWMRSAFLREADGDLLKHALINDQTVIVLCAGETDFPAALADFWIYYTDDPHHTFGSAVRNLRFEPLSAGQTPSRLMVVHLQRGDSPWPRQSYRLALTADLLDALVEHEQPAEQAGEESTRKKLPVAVETRRSAWGSRPRPILVASTRVPPPCVR